MKKRFSRPRFGTLRLALPALALLLSALLLAALPVSGEEGVYSDVVRLHILAESDDEGDQADKLAVRDAILTEYRAFFDGFSDKGEAAAALTEEKLNEIRETAKGTLLSRGKTADVSVTYSREIYPTRTYGDYTLPAGEYDSLRVVIGAGEGKNWWCVLFPPLCTAASCEGVPLGLSDSEYRLLTEGKMSVRFKSLELLSLLFSK